MVVVGLRGMGGYESCVSERTGSQRTSGVAVLRAVSPQRQAGGGAGEWLPMGGEEKRQRRADRSPFYRAEEEVGRRCSKAVPAPKVLYVVVAYFSGWLWLM